MGRHQGLTQSWPFYKALQNVVLVRPIGASKARRLGCSGAIFQRNSVWANVLAEHVEQIALERAVMT
jgi:hypothetical protein